jgi:hypothetical protein
MGRWTWLWILGGCGSWSAPEGPPVAVATVAAPSPAVPAAPSPAVPAAPDAKGALAVGADARLPADLPLDLTGWTARLTVSAPEGSFVQASPPGGRPTDIDDLEARLRRAGCDQPEVGRMPGMTMITCPPGPRFATLVVRVPDGAAPITVAWRAAGP